VVIPFPASFVFASIERDSGDTSPVAASVRCFLSNPKLAYGDHRGTCAEPPRSRNAGHFSLLDILALTAEPADAIENLRRMKEFDWIGLYGFYEAIDYTHAGGQVVRSWMAHIRA
jgi:hypothetical protein